MTLLCTATGCRIPGKHLTDCADQTCRGCVPDLAGEGLRLCWRHADAIGANAVACAALWSELALNLTVSGRGDSGGRGSNPHPSLVVNEAVVEVRTAIRHTLVGWARLIHEERGVSLPWRWEIRRLPAGVEGPANRAEIAVETTAALGRYMEAHGRWLAAHEAAGECSNELASLVVAARRLQGRGETRVIPIGPCPMEDCAGTLRGLLRTERSLLPSAVSCDADAGHEWTAADWPALAASIPVTA